MLECLDSLVAFVPANCDCLPSVPEGFPSVTSSEFGFCLSDKMPTDFIAACGEATIWHTMKRMREDAKANVFQSFMLKIKAKGQISSHYTGYVGSDTGDIITAGTNYVAQKWTINAHKRGVLSKIKSVMFWANTSGTKNFRISDRNGTVIHEQEIVFAGNETEKWVSKSLSTTVKIPMWNDDQGSANYVYFMWDEPTTKGNQDGCFGCSGGAPAWSKYFSTAGVFLNDWDNVTANTSSETLNGMRVNVTIECGFEELLCAANDDVRMTIAICLQYQWACSLIEWIIDSGQINKWTSLGGEYLEGLLTKNKGRFDENLSYLTDTIYTGDCIQCNNVISKTSLRK